MTTPRLQSSPTSTKALGAHNETERQKAIKEVTSSLGNSMFLDSADAEGRELADCNSLCRIAGLNVEWVGLKAKARTLGIELPYRLAASSTRGEAMTRRDDKAVRQLRAWAHAFAPDLIDQTVAQPQAFVSWRWW